MLNPNAARTDLTDRELAKIIGGLLGSLSQMCNLVDLRNAIKWWAENDKNWEMLEYAGNVAMKQAMQYAKETCATTTNK